MKATIHTVMWVLGLAAGSFMNYAMFNNTPALQALYRATPDLIGFVLGGGIVLAFAFYGLSKWIGMLYTWATTPFKAWLQRKRLERAMNELKAIQEKRAEKVTELPSNRMEEVRKEIRARYG